MKESGRKDTYKKECGKSGEDRAVEFLQEKGYNILFRNWRIRTGEIDIIAEKENLLVFVEVKTRTNDFYGNPKDAVGVDKKRRYYQIAKFYSLEIGEEPNARFDVAEVDEQGEINYIKNAF